MRMLFMAYNLELAKTLIDRDTVVFWFRRDLRLHDNAGLYYALKDNKRVMPLFIFDTVILHELNNRADARIHFIHQSLAHLKKSIEETGSSLLVLHGDPKVLFKQLNPLAVYTNNDYEPYAINRDRDVAKTMEGGGAAFHSFKDQVIFEKDDVTKDTSEPYTVFTPYSKKWKATLNEFHIKAYPVEKYFSSFKKVAPLPMPSLADLGFRESDISFPERVIKRSIIKNYDKLRDFPAADGTSRLSVHLRFGTVSIRELVKLAMKTNDTWLNELIWREFYQMILWHFPTVVSGSFKPVYNDIPWRNNEDEFRAWCEGRTGYPLVDAGMRELNNTGYMHNRVRMITASFLTKHLLIDWRWGEAYFAEKLLDYDLAANNGGWQWAAGTGCDAAPYFRIFNPIVQAKRFDPDLRYIKKWIPELDTNKYPLPIVEHSSARERALRTYQAVAQMK